MTEHDIDTSATCQTEILLDAVQQGIEVVAELRTELNEVQEELKFLMSLIRRQQADLDELREMKAKFEALVASMESTKEVLPEVVDSPATKTRKSIPDYEAKLRFTQDFLKTRCCRTGDGKIKSKKFDQILIEHSPTEIQIKRSEVKRLMEDCGFGQFPGKDGETHYRIIIRPKISFSPTVTNSQTEITV